MEQRSMPASALPLQVKTATEPRIVGWLIVVPFAALFWLFWLGALAFGVSASVNYAKGMSDDSTTIALFALSSLLLPLLTVVIYFFNGWMHDFLAT